MNKLAYNRMHNHFLEQSPSSSRASPSSGRSSPQSPSDICAHHALIPLKAVKGFSGWRQQRCILCNNMTTWVCQECTAGPLALVPICAEKTYVRSGADKGKYIRHGCLQRHRDNPALLPSGRKRKSAKSRRVQQPQMAQRKLAMKRRSHIWRETAQRTSNVVRERTMCNLDINMLQIA